MPNHLFAANPTGVRTLAVVLLLGLAGPALAWENESVRLEGETGIRYDARFLSSGGEDQDWRQSADLYFAETAWNHFRLSFSGDLFEDTDGNALGAHSHADDGAGTWTEQRVSDVRDTFDSGFHGYLYRAWAELADLGPLDRLRVGRQYLGGPLPAHLDGGTAEFAVMDRKIRFGAYGGLPVRYFDLDTEWWDAQQAGAWISGRCHPTHRITLAYQFWREEGDERTADQHQAALEARQDLGQYLRLTATFIWLDDEPRSLKFRAGAMLDEYGFDALLTYYGQFVAIDDVPSSASPFTELLGPLKPYHRVSLLATQRLVADLFLDLAVDVRLLQSSGDAGAFNHAYHHESLGLSYDNLLVRGLRLAVHADVWQDLSDELDTLIFAGGGELRYDRPDLLRVAVGGDYSLFKYDYLLDQDEKTQVYTVFAKGRLYPLSWLFLEVRYELEIYDIEAHRLTAVVGQRF